MLNVRVAALHLVEVVVKRSLALADLLRGVLGQRECSSGLVDRSWFAEEMDHLDLCLGLGLAVVGLVSVVLGQGCWLGVEQALGQWVELRSQVFFHFHLTWGLG
jgi:hypothetical protein